MTTDGRTPDSGTTEFGGDADLVGADGSAADASAVTAAHEGVAEPGDGAEAADTEIFMLNVSGMPGSLTGTDTAVLNSGGSSMADMGAGSDTAGPGTGEDVAGLTGGSDAAGPAAGSDTAELGEAAAGGDVAALAGDDAAGEDVAEPAAGPDVAEPAAGSDEAASVASADATAVLPGTAKTAKKIALFGWVPGLFRWVPPLFGWVPPLFGWVPQPVRRWGGAVARITRIWQPGPGIRENADPGGRAFAMVTIMPALLLIAWLVPGLALLLAHAFLPAPMVLIVVPGVVALTMLAARQIPGRWPALDAREQEAREQDGKERKIKGRSWAAWWGLTGTVLIAAVFAVWQIVENSPQFIVSRDPGAYTQFAYWIANHGHLPIPAAPTAFGSVHTGLSFTSFGFTSHGASVVPSVTSGLPILLSAGLWVHGVTGATVISPLIGALAVLAVGGLTGRLAGPQWAPAGAFLLALTVPEIYTSRSAFSDTLAQALLFGGLCLVVDSFSARRPVILAALGGVTLGLTVLAGISFLLILLPTIPVAGALLASRKPQAIPFAAGLLGGVFCGLAAGIGLDFPAVSGSAPTFAIIGIVAAALAVLTGIGVGIGLVGPVRRFVRKVLAKRPLRWLPDLAATLVVLAAIGLAVRPYLQKVRGADSPYIAALQRLESLPVDPGRLYSENTLYWVIWYLGAPALLLGIIGLAMVIRRCARALITWQDPGGAARALALPAFIIGWGLFAVLWQPETVPDQPWASRQLVPVILPGLVLLAVWVAAWLIGRAHARDAGPAAVAMATACFVVALAVPTAAITFGIEFSQPANPATRTALSGLAFRHTGEGQVDAVERLCGAIPRNSSVLLVDKVAARAFAEVVRGTCGAPAAIVTGSATGQVDALIGNIERAGHHPVLLATRSSELTPYGAFPREVVSLSTQQDAHLLTRPPTSTWPVHYVLWMSAPSSTVVGS